MPWVSKAQRGYMHVHHPEIAKRWDEHTPKGKKLPEHVKKHKKKAAAFALASIGIKLADVGPYMGDLAATVKSQDDMVGSIARNRDQRFGQYLLNPYVSGPIHEILTRLGRRVNAGRAAHPTFAKATAGGILNPLNLVGYPAAAVMGGPEAREKARGMYEESQAPSYEEAAADKETDERQKARHQKHAAGEGPFATERSGLVSGLDKQIAMMSRNRHEHPGHYYANPFVYGPLSELLSRAYRRYNASQATIPSQAYIRGTATGLSNPAAGLMLPSGIKGPAQLAEMGMGVTGAVTGDAGHKTKAREIFEGSGAPDYSDVAEDKETVKKDKARHQKNASVPHDYPDNPQAFASVLGRLAVLRAAAKEHR